MIEPTELLKALRNNAEFFAVMEGEMKPLRPMVPAYRATFSAEDEYKQQMVLRNQSARQEGFDLLWLALTGKKISSPTTTGESNA